MKVYVSGVGIVSAIGLNVNENLNALRLRKSGIKRSAANNLMLGEVALSNQQIIDLFELPQIDYSRTTLLSMVAAKEAWGENKHFDDLRTGLIAATSIGAMDKLEEYYRDVQQNSSSQSYTLMTNDNGRTTEMLAHAFGISGYIGTISTACSSGANAIMLGARMIQGNKLDRVLVGGCDPMADFDVKGFKALNIYDHEICKPFDDNRKGLNLGEGAAYLILENEYSLSKTGNTPLCELAGWNNSTDAFHQTASSANGLGASMAMVKALKKAGINTRQIDYINAHGTGTENNDLSETMALKEVFGDSIPPFSSTKGFTGHTLAAAGAIEAVFCILSILNQATLPNINFSTPMNETGLMPETDFRTIESIDYVLSNSFGFGGNCSCLIFAKA